MYTLQRANGISQEWLKAIACLTMFVDHMGAIFYPQTVGFRIVGRIAFPIYCFLLAEGVFHTKNPIKYGLRLLLGAILAEIPFDFALYGRFTWLHQNVMFTLLLGFLAAETMCNCKTPLLAIPLAVLSVLAGQWLNADYGGFGVLFVLLFTMTRGKQHQYVIQSIGLLIICAMMNSRKIPILGQSVPLELFAVLAMIPICLYSGEKKTFRKSVQLAFYLFYPIHLSVLAAIHLIL